MPSTSGGAGSVPALELAPEELKEAAAAAASASHASSGDKIRFAPRAARYKLQRIREEFQLSASQFAQMLSGAEHWNQSHVNRWEVGLERVPNAVATKADKLHAQMLRKAAMQPKPEEPPMMLVQPEYPNQEPMLGPDYQATVSKHGGGSKEKKEPRRDVCVWSVRTAGREGINVDSYLVTVRELLKGVESLEYDENASLTTLHDLKYNEQSALESLRLCVAWEQGDWQKVQALPRHSSAILWLQRLRSAAIDSKQRWTAGQKEALDAACEVHGKELAEVHKHTLQELPYPKFIQLYYQCSHLPRPPASP